MNVNTGDIISNEDFEKLSAGEKEDHVQIPDENLKRVVKMNRKQRRAWAAKQRGSKRAS